MNNLDLAISALASRGWNQKAVATLLNKDVRTIRNRAYQMDVRFGKKTTPRYWEKVTWPDIVPPLLKHEGKRLQNLIERVPKGNDAFFILCFPHMDPWRLGEWIDSCKKYLLIRKRAASLCYRELQAANSTQNRAEESDLGL